MSNRDVEAIAKAVERGQRRERDKRNAAGLLGFLALFGVGPIVGVWSESLTLGFLAVLACFIGIALWWRKEQ